MPWPKGRPRSEETKRKISAGTYKALSDPEVRARMSFAHSGERNHFYGRQHPPEVMERIRQSQLGKTLSKEHRHKISESLIGNQRASGNHFSLTLEQRLHLSKLKRGEKCHFWKGGVTPEHSRIRASSEYRAWRSAVFQRDNYTCQECGARSGKGQAVYLQADHIKPFSRYPDLRFSIENGRTLCLDCHHKTPTFGVNAQYA